MDVCQQGESMIVSILHIIFIPNQHPIAVGRTMCAAMPRRFLRASNMYALSAVVFGAPPCVNAACANIGFLKSQLCGGLVPFCCLFSCGSRVLPFFVSSSVSCLLCGGGLLGLGEGPPSL